MKKSEKQQKVLQQVQMGIMRMYYSMSVAQIGAKFSRFLKLYHESLASLVQGYREVTMDAEGTFKFEDNGETVKQRLNRYENKLKERTSGVSAQSSEVYEQMK